MAGYGIALVVIALTAGLIGFMAGRRADTRDVLRATGLTKDAFSMYMRAVKILRRLDGLTELDGEFAADILTPETKRQVTEWVADYRKGLDRK